MRQKEKSLKILIAAGGTGGHLFPAQALALDLIDRKKELEIVFASPRLKTNFYFNKEWFPFYEISAATPFKKNMIQGIKSLGTLMRGIFQSWKLLTQLKPSLVIGFGSFHSFPILIAAKIKGIPIILFESNTVPGRVNRFCSRFAEISAVHFLKAAQKLKGRVACVRTPLLKRNTGIDSATAHEYFHLDSHRLTFLVFGGSQGSQAINQFFCESLEMLLQKGISFQVIHIVGSTERAAKLREIYSYYAIPAAVKSFEQRMDLAWSAADLMISRAGAVTLAEQIEFGVPGILIPYPFGMDNHQKHNASFVASEIGGGIALSEKELSAESLTAAIDDLLKSSQAKLKIMKQALQEYKMREETRDLYALILDFLAKKNAKYLI